MTNKPPEPVRQHLTSPTSRVTSLATLKLLSSLVLATTSQGVALGPEQWLEVCKQVWQVKQFAR